MNAAPLYMPRVQPLASNQRGRTLTIRADGSLQGCIETEELLDQDTWCVAAQVSGQGGANTFPVGSFLLVTYWVGNATYTLPPVPLPTISPSFVMRAVVDATKVRVDVLAGASGNAGNITVSVARGGKVLGPERSGGRWINQPNAAASLADNYQIVGTGGTVGVPGSLYAATVNVVALAAAVTTAWVLLFDQNGGGRPAASAVPIAGGRSSQLSAGNPSAQFDGTFTPMQWNLGLVAALSTTADVYTQPAAGCTFTFDGFAGQ